MIGKTLLDGNFDILYKNIYSYTEPDQTFYNHHWLSGVIFYLFDKMAGFEALVILKVAVLLSAFLLLFATALKKSNFWVVAFFSIPTIIILAERSDVRPEMFSYFFIAAYLYLLIDFEKHPERKTIFLLIPLQLLWVNMHVFFSVGIMMVGAFLFEQIIVHRRHLRGNPFIKKLFILLAAVILVSLINPRGIKGVLYQYPEGPVVISENVSLDSFKKSLPPWDDVSAALFTPMVFVAGAGFLLGWRRKLIFYFLATLATGILGFLILRSIAMFGMIFLLAASANFNPLFEKLKNALQRESFKITRNIGVGLSAIIIAVLLYLIFIFAPQKMVEYEEPGIGVRHDSHDSAAFFKDEKLKGPIFNDANLGSYLIYELYPQEKVFTDNRFADAYSASFFNNDYFPAIRTEAGWQETMRKYNFNVIFFHHFIGGLEERKFLSRRASDPAWALVYADAYNLIFVRDIPQNERVIQKFRITPDNALQKLRHLIDSSYINDQIAAADILNILGKTDLALGAYFKIASTWPERHRIWQVMGQMEVHKNDPTDLVLATTFFQRAIDEGAGTAEVYSYLGLAYYKLNLIENARAAALKSLELDPEREDAIELLETIKTEIGE